MLAIQQSKSHQGRCTANVLPCRVNHSGEVNASRKYWDPIKSEDSKRTAYFRGRKMHGNTVTVPEGYRGVVVSSTDKVLPREPASPEQDDTMDELEEVIDVAVLEEHAEFAEIVVWGHEVVVDEKEDPYIRGVEEWMTFSTAIHTYKADGQEGLVKTLINAQQ